MIFFANFNIEKALRVKFKLYNEEVELIIDSGASCCLLDRKYIPTNFQIDPRQQIEVRGVNGVTTTLGYVDTFLNFNSTEYPIRFHRMEKLPSNIIGLIGTNFLKKYNAKIDFAKMKMEFDIPEEENCFTIPARTEIIKYVETNFSEACVVLNDEIMPQVFIANSIVTPVNGKIPIRMVNFRNKKVSVKALQPEIKSAKDYLVIETKYTKELDHLSSSEKETIVQICIKYADIFCLAEDKLTVTKIYNPEIKTVPSAQPIYSKPYKIPHVQKAEAEQQIQKMIGEQIIEKACSPWNSPILLVPKKSSGDTKKWRLVIDYRKLNTVIEDDKFPLPNIDDIIDALAGAKYFSHLDLSQGYYQCQLRPEDRPVTAFSTPSGQYQMTRLPMGLKISPSVFSRLMTIAMSGLDMTKCLVYLDDIIVFGKTIDEHNKNLTRIFERFRQVNLKLNPGKCKFFKTELLYLGHLISAEGVKPDPAKTEAVKKWPTPQNADEVKRFVAFANYYRKHIKDFAKICSPLNYLTRKEVKFEWNAQCEEAFEKLKHTFLNPPILDYPNFNESITFHLHTDASGYAIGAVLSNNNGKPIAYASKTLNKAELNYPTIEKELLALVWAIRHFRPYLYGRKFVVHTDHRPLVYLFSLTDPSSRLTKFRLALEEYLFDIFYIPGKDNLIADALSRIPISDLKELVMTVTTRSKSMVEQKNNKPVDMKGTDQPKMSNMEYKKLQIDPDIKEIKVTPEIIWIPPTDTLLHLRGIMEKVVEYLKKQENTNIVIEKTESSRNLIKTMKELKREIKGMPEIIILGENKREITDDKMKYIIINDHHLLPTAGHAGIQRTIKTIRKRYFWKNLNKDVTQYIKKCTLCQKYKKITGPKVPLTITTTANSAFEKIYLDLVGPLLKSFDNNQYILTTQCELTKFITATPIPNKSTEVVAKAFVENVILNYGIPKEIATDRGTEFMSQVFSEVCKLLKINKLNSTAYHHETIGALENSHKMLGNYLRIFTTDKLFEWSSWVKYYQFAYNNTVHSETNRTPFELVYGKLCNIPSNITTEKELSPAYNLDDYAQILKIKLQISQKQAKNDLEKAKLERVANCSKNIQIKIYEPGTSVLLKNETSGKLDTIYNGPYTVIKDMNPNIMLQIGSKVETVHKNRIKPYTQ